VPEAWWPVIRDETPAYDPRTATTRQMGAIANAVVHWPGARRSTHPHLSVTALGPLAERVVEPHPLPYGIGDTSPFAHLYDLGADVLLLGVGHANNSSLHLAEHRATWPGKRTYEEGAAVLVNGTREWVTFTDLVTDDSDFEQVGAAYEASGGRVSVGRVGAGTARLMPQRDLVDFGVGEITRRRGEAASPAPPAE
jgi:aminoglycoside 3-N-acetyltransferase